MRTRSWLAPTCALALCLGAGARATAYIDSELARTGQIAPGTGGATFWQFGNTRVNDAGAVAFYARARSANSTVYPGLFVAEGGSVRKVAYTGDALPGPPGASIMQIESYSQVPAFNAHGEVAFVAFVSAPTTTRGVYLSSDAGVTAVALSGDPAPISVGGTFSFFGHAGMDLSDAGELVFMGTVATGVGVFRDALFRASGGALGVIAEQGAPAPGGPGATWSGFGTPSINTHGDVAFRGFIDSPEGSRRVVALARDGAIEVVAERDDPAPRTGGGTFVDFNDGVAIDDFGAVLFLASVRDGEVTHGVFRHSAAGVSALAVPGDAIPVPNATLAYLPYQPSLSRSGLVALPAFVETPAGSLRAVFKANQDDLELVRLAGDAAPGGSSYVELSQQPAIDSSGRVSFTSSLADGSAGAFLGMPAPQVPAIDGAARIAAAALLLLSGAAASTRARKAQR